MRVEEIINTLRKRYHPDEQLIIMWWDRFGDYGADPYSVDERVWKRICDEYTETGGPYTATSIIHDNISDLAQAWTVDLNKETGS